MGRCITGAWCTLVKKTCPICGGDKFTVWTQVTGTRKDRLVVICERCYFIDGYDKDKENFGFDNVKVVC